MRPVRMLTVRVLFVFFREVIALDYKGKRWQRLRERALIRDRYQCRQCRRYGLAVNASVVHHAWPAEEYPELAWELDNLVSLCKACHNAMHIRDTDALTDLGMSWMRRVPPSQRAR